ncbi:MAG: 2OG-Fe(II) oxygenase, partial [Thiohalocapsa sp.]
RCIAGLNSFMTCPPQGGSVVMDVRPQHNPRALRTGRSKHHVYQVQRYLPGQFYHWHVDGGSHELSQRQLVAIWYLNDVPGPGGETQFLYQNLCVRPERGKLVLFPPFWTHEHRAARLEAGVKYIATTWIVFG